MSQSGLQTCYAGASSEHPEFDKKPAGGKSPGAGVKNPSPALLILLYAAAIAAGLALSVAVTMGNDRLRKWVVACSAAAFCLLTLQMMLGFPVEGWLKGLPTQLSQQRNATNLDDQMGMAVVVGAVESGAIIVRYTVFVWLSCLAAVIPAVVLVGEDWIARAKGGRATPPYPRAFTHIV